MEKQSDIVAEGLTASLHIDGYADLHLYKTPEAYSLSLTGDPMDIKLLVVKEGAVLVENSFSSSPSDISAAEGLWLAFPKGKWSTRLHTSAGAVFYLLDMNAKVFHNLINPLFDSHQLESAPKINMRDMARQMAIAPSLMVCFDQLCFQKLQKPFQSLFEQAKFFEIFSLLMEATLGHHADACPVMMTPAIEDKIHQVRRHIISRPDETPDPDQLALSYELPRNTLKEGYRYLFGKTIHQYHADYKLEYAMQMLSSGELLVKEIAFRIGYQNPSHFISAFKKKYGFTPKQYLKREPITA
jgi:AraC-like DNA-binding protein